MSVMATPFKAAEAAARGALQELLDAIEGPKDLILDSQLVVMLNRIVGFAFLKVL